MVPKTFFATSAFALLLFTFVQSVQAETRFFPIQAIDTMKVSRDRARENISPERIEIMVARIAEAGATHVAIGTPYEEEFVPVVKQWVSAARKYKLNVWFRGNAAGWEEWFDYPRISRRVHTLKIKEFIEANPDLFIDGDIFVSCPECENGGPGDPRETGDVNGFRQFLIDEYTLVQELFHTQNKQIITHYFSMNGDVARLVMDKATTRALGGAITIDHYVKDVDVFMNDIEEYASQSGGQVVLGEWGAPIPDIHGDMTAQEQARYVNETMRKLLLQKKVIALNYWTATESSTHLWNDDGSPRPALETLRSYFQPAVFHARVVDNAGKTVQDFSVETPYHLYQSTNGTIKFPFLPDDAVSITHKDYETLIIHPAAAKQNANEPVTLILSRTKSTLIDELLDHMEKLSGFFSFFEKL